jgi:hypothetical protein
MSLVLAHVTGAAHDHGGDLVVAVLAVLLVLAIGLAPALWRAARSS